MLPSLCSCKHTHTHTENLYLTLSLYLPPSLCLSLSLSPPPSMQKMILSLTVAAFFDSAAYVMVSHSCLIPRTNHSHALTPPSSTHINTYSHRIAFLVGDMGKIYPMLSLFAFFLPRASPIRKAFCALFRGCGSLTLVR